MRNPYHTHKLLDDVTYRRLCRAKDFLAANYRDRVRLEDAARAACLSPWHFLRLYARAFHETPHKFLTRLRIDEAKRRLAIGSDSATDICLDLGYESLGTFSWRFRSLVGCSPREYRRHARRIFTIPFAWYAASIPCCFLKLFGISREPQDRRRNAPAIPAS
jgi:AraC-like DNA-binding protein